MKPHELHKFVRIPFVRKTLKAIKKSAKDMTINEAISDYRGIEFEEYRKLFKLNTDIIDVRDYINKNYYTYHWWINNITTNVIRILARHELVPSYDDIANQSK